MGRACIWTDSGGWWFGFEGYWLLNRDFIFGLDVFYFMVKGYFKWGFI